MTELDLSPQVFLILSRMIEEASGLHYDSGERELLAAKVAPRALERGFDSLLDYYYFLRYDPEGPKELAALLDRLVVHETYFFREVEPLVALSETFIAPRVRAGEKLRIWSAACATGEEPLSLAMVLAGRGLLSSVEIVATDVSERVLERAKRGEFNGRALRAAPHPEMRSFLDMSGWVSPLISSSVTWRCVNLIDRAAVAALGAFDVVLCRNVLIYFSDATAARVLDNIGRSMRDEGVLLVGVSESLLRFDSALRCEEHAGSFFYRMRRP